MNLATLLSIQRPKIKLIQLETSKLDKQINAQPLTVRTEKWNSPTFGSYQI